MTEATQDVRETAPRGGWAVSLRRVAGAAMALAAGGVLLLGAAATSMPRAHANGVPTVVKLAYIDGLSNWGPREATGTAELAFAEGTVRVDATGLPRLNAQRYEGWIVNSQTNEAVSAGTFNADGASKVAYNGTLPPINNFGFDLFILTIEPDPDADAKPSGQRSIGGRFTLVGQQTISDGSRPADAQGAAPGQLPNTGESWMHGDIVRLGVLLGAVALSLGVGVTLARRRA